MPIRNNSLNSGKITEIFNAGLSWLGQNSEQQLRTAFEWGVVAFAAGIAVYFALPFEPSLPITLIFCAAFGAIYKFASPEKETLRTTSLVLLLIFLGVGRSAWHSKAVEQPQLPGFERAYWVTGWVSAIEKSGPRERWKIEVSNIDGLDADKTPGAIRTTAAGAGVEAGDFIRIRSVLSAPRGPVVSGGYDPARRAFFQGLGGTGFAISKAESAEKIDQTWPQAMRRSLIRLRYGLAKRVLEAAPAETAGLQVGLMTGIRTYIPEEQTASLRIAGLAHILAISGLHMGLMAGGVYFMATLCMACIGPLARRYDVRKPAAMIGVTAATAYLLVSGASVATQRAFIMTCIVFLAVILDRRALTMRSVALAALVTLLWHPEAITGVGFQMSFAAVAALVAVYRAWDTRREYVQRGAIGRAAQSLNSLTVTSFVAGTATSGFAMLHFNRIASYGLAGNILAMPIFTFWVMPAALAVFPALLIGREDIPLAIMGKGLEVMLQLSRWVESWPESILYIPAGPTWLIGVFGLAFAGLCLGPRLARTAGAVCLPLCFGLWLMAPQPDLRISSDGAVAFWSDGDTQTLYVNRKRADRYGREQFARRAGEGAATLKTYQKDRALCDPLGCRAALYGVKVAITGHPSEVLAECETADLVILTERDAGPLARRNCQAMLIDGRVLREGGGQDIYLRAQPIRVRPANSKARAARPWGK